MVKRIVQMNMHTGLVVTKMLGPHEREANYQLLVRLVIGVVGTTFGFLMGLFLMFASMSVKASDANGEIFCLAKNIYFEAGNQPVVGKIAVSHVVLNRVESQLYPDTVCDVIYEAETRINWKGNEVPIRGRCQFSWYCDGLSDEPVDSKTWISSVILARRIIDGEWYDVTEGATHYHADSVHPYWADSLNETVVINNHLFYK